MYNGTNIVFIPLPNPLINLPININSNGPTTWIKAPLIIKRSSKIIPFLKLLLTMKRLKNAPIKAPR